MIDNDFQDRKDLTPNVCAVYIEKEYRCQGIVGICLEIFMHGPRRWGDQYDENVYPSEMRAVKYGD